LTCRWNSASKQFSFTTSASMKRAVGDGRLAERESADLGGVKDQQVVVRAVDGRVREIEVVDRSVPGKV
jgi:hypothetical protein